MKKLLSIILLLIALLPLNASVEHSLAITSGYDIYGLTEEPIFLHSIPLGISDENYFLNNHLGLLSEFEFYFPQYYMYGNTKSPENTFRSSFYADYALYLSGKIDMKHIDLFCGLGFFAGLRFLHFNQTGGLQMMLNAGPGIKLGTDINITNHLSLRIAVNGSMYVLREDYLSPSAGNGLRALSFTPEAGITIHF